MTENEQQSQLNDYGEDEHPSELRPDEEEEIQRGLFDSFESEDETESSEEPLEHRIVRAYNAEIDPKLVDAGWGFEAAKSTEHGKTDQSLVNHVRNGVTALARVNELIESVGGTAHDESTLREAVALFTIHDIHKLDETRDTDPESRFDIPKAEVERYVEQFGLLEWADSLKMADFHACAVDHHDDWTSNDEMSTLTFIDRRPLIRLADAFASSETPETGASRSVRDAITAAYPEVSGSVDLRYHRLDDVKGILTNLLNAAVAELLSQTGYEQLLIYQDGCVYLSSEASSPPDLDDAFVDKAFDELKRLVRSSHVAYDDYTRLVGNISTLHAQNRYKVNNQDFFYAGVKNVLQATALKGTKDADPEDTPTDSMSESMAELEKFLPFEIDRTREPVGLARFVYTVKRLFLDPVLDATGADASEVEATCELFGVSEAVQSGLTAAGEELSLTAGGKWDYAYGIGQALLNEGVTDHTTLARRVADGLAAGYDDWTTVVEAEHAGNLGTELRAYLHDVISVDGATVTREGAGTTDPLDEYPGSRRGKTCVLCNRGTTGTKGDMKAPKSLTTLQAGYSNHIAVDAGKPDELLACYPCKIELSLRETGSGRREGGRLWMHFVPDYFYTPYQWRRYTAFTEQFNTEARTELGQLAESVLRVGRTDSADTDGGNALGSYVDALLSDDYGRSMVETLDQGFDPESAYGARTFGYFKPKDNDAEFQFFGVFVALALATYTGLRVVVSESPIPDVRGRDFQAYARIGAGFTQVHDFYGTEIPLSALRSRVSAAAALIRLGYGSDREDALFAKYLRATRNKLLPGAYLLKRLAQADDGSDAQYLLEEARVLDEERGGRTDTRATESE